MSLTKTAVIVGYGTGISAATAQAFAAEGYALALVARNPEKLEAAAQSLRAGGTDVHPYPADASRTDSLTEAVAEIARRQGDPEIVLYNAFAWRGGPVLATQPADLEADLRACIGGALVAARAFAPAMTQARAGALLFTGGGFALYPSPQAPTLSIGKAGIRALALMLAQELSPAGVTVGTVTVLGQVAPDTPFAPERIAQAFLALRRDGLGPELFFDGAGEKGFRKP